MPFTVITLKNSPMSLRGDLTKWMQEIATGVYVGNFNSRVREQLWQRVLDTVADGEATISYTLNNEIGYQFTTVNACRETLNYEGIPLVFLRKNDKQSSIPSQKLGFSKAAVFHRCRYRSNNKTRPYLPAYVVIDIETTGLDPYRHQIIEIAAVKKDHHTWQEFHYLINIEQPVPQSITNLTGITTEVLVQQGKPLSWVLREFLQFVGDLSLVGYGLNFDSKFIDCALRQLNLPLLTNRRYDLIKYVKNDKILLANYKLATVLLAYGIDECVPHRALTDAKLIYELSTKVNGFLTNIELNG